MSSDNTSRGDKKTKQKEPSIIYDFDPRNLPPEYHQAIGLVVASSAQTEHTLNDFIGGLLGIDNVQCIALTQHMTFPLKDHIIRTLVELEAPNLSELDKIDELLDAVQAAIASRNTIVHSSFLIHPDTREVFSQRITARGKISHELKKIPVEEIEKIADNIYQAGTNIITFMASRGLDPTMRTNPLKTKVKRSSKAREGRRS